MSSLYRLAFEVQRLQLRAFSATLFLFLRNWVATWNGLELLCNEHADAHTHRHTHTSAATAAATHVLANSFLPLYVVSSLFFWGKNILKLSALDTWLIYELLRPTNPLGWVLYGRMDGEEEEEAWHRTIKQIASKCSNTLNY